MNKRAKIIIGIVVAVAVVGGVGFLIFSNQPAPTVTVLSPVPTAAPSIAAPPPSPAPEAASPPAPETVSPPTPVMPPPASPSSFVSTVTVTNTDVGFFPAIVSIQKGGTVRFVNQSSEKMWVGSNPHPVHNGYPTTGGCKASTFDSCRGVLPGEAWEFTFDIAGTWGYHDHLNPGKGGRITVE